MPTLGTQPVTITGVTMTDSFLDVADLTVEERLQYHHDDGKPHWNEQILRYLLHEQDKTLRDAAETLEAVFGYSVSHTTVKNARNDLGLKRTSTFAEVESKGNDTEIGQPSSSDLTRSTDPVVHPLDTECFDESSDVWGEVDPSMVESTANNTLNYPSQSNSTASNTDSTDQPLQAQSKQTCQWRVSKSEHEFGLIAPPYKVTEIPDQYRVCGCGDCNERHYLDGTNGAVDCPKPLPCTVGGGREIYQKAEGTGISEDKQGNDANRGRHKYKQMCYADSAALRVDLSNAEFDDNGDLTSEDVTYVLPRPNLPNITTSLVSLRLSNTDSQGRLVTPYTLIQDCKSAFFEARPHFPNDPEEDGFIASYYLFTGTDKWGTVHLHQYSWYFDPTDSVGVSDFQKGVKEFDDASTFAADAHLTDDDQIQQGCVRIEHEPLPVDPEVLQSNSGTTTISTFTEVTKSEQDELKRLTDGVDYQTRGSIYVATQLPELALVGAESPADAEFTAALKAAYDGRQTSYGIGYFYQLVEDLETLLEDEQVVGSVKADEQSRGGIAGD